MGFVHVKWSVFFGAEAAGEMAHSRMAARPWVWRQELGLFAGLDVACSLRPEPVLCG